MGWQAWRGEKKGGEEEGREERGGEGGVKGWVAIEVIRGKGTVNLSQGFFFFYFLIFICFALLCFASGLSSFPYFCFPFSFSFISCWWSSSSPWRRVFRNVEGC